MINNLSIRFARKQLRVGEEFIDEWADLFEFARDRSGAPVPDERTTQLISEFKQVAYTQLNALPMLRRISEVLREHFEAAELTGLRATCQRILDLFNDGVTLLQRVEAQAEYLKTAGSDPAIHLDLVAAVAEVQAMADRARHFLAWLDRPASPPDPVTLAESRNAFEAGEYQELGEMIRGLQSGSHQAG